LQKRTDSKRERPWWLFAVIALGAWFGYRIVSDDLYADILAVLIKGVGITGFVTVTAFSLASAVGLLLAIAVLSRYLWLRQVARFYIEVIRGIPMLVLLLYIAFVGTPILVSVINSLRDVVGADPIRIRDIPLVWRAILALTIGYSAFIAEVFRAGIQAVGSGQIEAARTLGLSSAACFRYVIFPQALRTILPPLGNDFIAMIKDSALVSVLGVTDITQLGKVYAAGSFRFLETYNVVAYLYLSVTIGLSLMLRRVERWLARKDTS